MFHPSSALWSMLTTSMAPVTNCNGAAQFVWASVMPYILFHVKRFTWVWCVKLSGLSCHRWGMLEPLNLLRVVVL